MFSSWRGGEVVSENPSIFLSDWIPIFAVNKRQEIVPIDLVYMYRNINVKHINMRGSESAPWDHYKTT